jgi:hypothetical protein
VTVVVNVFYAKSNIRSVLVSQACAFGLKKLGARVRLRECRDHKIVDADFAVHYGFADQLRRVYEDYKRESTVVYIDLGYWKRRIRTRYDGYYKFAVNSRHPTAYFMNNDQDMSRAKDLGIKVQPWLEREGEYIVLAGMSEKAARAEGLEHQVWERTALQTLLRHTDREIIYRAKPNCCRSRPIKGARFDKKMPVPELFSKAHAVVARHSNIAVEALCAGIPTFVDAGVALPMSPQKLVHVESPIRPEGRKQWAGNIAWCQFSLAEMKTGLPFLHLSKEGVIPDVLEGKG